MSTTLLQSDLPGLNLLHRGKVRDVFDLGDGHLLMVAHFLLTGYLFTWVLIGIDPGVPRWNPLMLLVILLPFMAKAQNTQNSEDGKKIDKEKLESKDYLPEIHGTIRGKYEYQTTMGAGRFEVRNARVSVTGNVLPIVAYKAEIDLSDEGSIKMLDAYASNG